MPYTLVEICSEVREHVASQWEDQCAEFGDEDKKSLVVSDTKQALDNEKYTHAVLKDVTGEYFALIGLVEAGRIGLDKVLEIRLNPQTNPEYRDELEIGLLRATQDIVGTITAVVLNGYSNDTNHFKIFGRGHDMKTMLKLVSELMQVSPVPGLTVSMAGGWLVFNKNTKEGV